MKRLVWVSYPLLAVALALLLQAQTCERGDTYLLSLQFEVGGADLVQGFNINNRSGYLVSTASCTATVSVETRMEDSTATYQWIVDGTSIESGQIGVGGGTVMLSIPDGQSELYIGVRAVEGNVDGYWVDVDRLASTAATIDFDDGVEQDPVASFYEGMGVTFSPNTLWLPNFVDVIYGGGGDATPPMSISVASVLPSVSDPMVATFCDPQSSVSILAVNVGEAGARLDAYDAEVDGTLVGFAEAFGATSLGEIKNLQPGETCATHPHRCSHEERLLSVSAASIRRVEIYRALDLSIDGVHFDNLAFEPAPGP